MRFTLLFLGLAACSTDTFATSDAATDGETDGTASVDGGGDGMSCPPPPSCTASQQCTTFDDAVAPFGVFNNTSMGGGMVGITTDHFVTCPAGMLASLPPTNGARATIGSTVGISPVAAVMVTLEVDAFLPTAVPGNVSFLAVGAAVDQSGVGLGAGVSGYYLFVQASGQAMPLTALPKLGAWNHIRLDVTFSADNSMGSALVTYDTDTQGRKSAQVKNSTLPGGSGAPSNVSAEVGPNPETTLPSVIVAYYDDVVFTP